ncbi:MAG: F0F1 ATP synthase subunit alpha [Candidatus Firestonebacteria bacterium]|nr:F0F1 ATP synthase subunit alpha [Candidatus Firestonebacteria bacterium]
MKISPEEVTQVIKQQLAGFASHTDVEEVGTVLQVGDGIARIWGLSGAMSMELLEMPHGVYGMVLNLERDNVGCVLLGEYEKIKEGDPVKRTRRVMEVPVGKALLGRVVNALGQPQDGRGDIAASATRPVERRAHGVLERQPVKEPLQTGIKAIDAMIPIGRGQRELIIGDRQTGKTAVAVDAIINQKNTDVVCVYVAVGQKQSTVAQVVKTLEEHGVMEKTIVVVASASEPAPMQYLAPYAGCAMAEEFMMNGGHALIVYDDLSKHAAAYRQMSLLLRRPPGREAYPGDVFYLHSRLLERASKLAQELGGGSLTALPIIETQAGDISAYIPTNVISITDGQIYLESNLFYSGQRPAVNSGLSVSRVGGNAQIKAMKQMAGRLRMDMSQYRELAAFAQFGSDLDKATQAQLGRGERMLRLLRQPQYQPVPVEEQVCAIFAGTTGELDDVAVEEISRFEKELLDYLRNQRPEILKTLREKKAFDEELQNELKEAVKAFKRGFK